MKYRFKADEWVSLTSAERIRQCLRLAVEAQEIADKATPELVPIYHDMADLWARLAGEIEKHSSDSVRTREARY